MDAAVEQLQTLLELETRHDELLERLAELDQRVAGVLAQCQGPGTANIPGLGTPKTVPGCLDSPHGTPIIQ